MPGIEIALASDVRRFLKGTGDAEGGLERVSDALDDTARDGDRAGDRLERTFREIAKDAKKTGDDIGDETRKGFRKAEDSADHFQRAAGDASGEFKQEFKQNASEVASSFTGDMTSAVDVVQGTLGGLASTDLPGIGIAAGLAGAAIGAIFTGLNANAEATKQHISDLTEAMIESNSKVIAESVIQDKLKEIATNADGAAISQKNLYLAAEQTGIEVGLLARAYAGDPGSVAQALATVQSQWDQADQARQSLDAGAAGDAINRQNELRRWKESLEGLTTNYDSAAAGYDLYQKGVQAGEARNQASIGETRKAYEDAHRAVDAIPTDKTTRVQVQLDTAEAERKLRTWRPVIVGVVRAGKAVV